MYGPSSESEFVTFIDVTLFVVLFRRLKSYIGFEHVSNDINERPVVNFFLYVRRYNIHKRNTNTRYDV